MLSTVTLSVVTRSVVTAPSWGARDVDGDMVSSGAGAVGNSGDDIYTSTMPPSIMMT